MRSTYCGPSRRMKSRTRSASSGSSIQTFCTSGVMKSRAALYTRFMSLCQSDGVGALAALLVDRPAAAAAGDLDVPDVQRRLVDVVDVEKGVTAEADIDEARAHAGQYVLDFAFVDGADDPFVTLDVVL